MRRVSTSAELSRPASAVWILGAIAGFVLVGCQGLPSDLVNQANGIPGRIENESARIATSERQYAEFAGSDGFEAVRRYAERERWPQRFDQAKASLKAAGAVHQKEVQPFLERNKPAEAQELRRVLAKIDPLLAAARDSAGHWSARRDFLLEVASEPGRWMQDCDTALADLRRVQPDLEARAHEARQDHDARAADIDQLLEPLRDLLGSATSAAAAASPEFEAIQAGGEGDLALLGDSCRQAVTDRDSFVAGANDLGAKLAELDRSYSRTLVDMRVDYGLLLRRQTWDERFDYPTLHNLDYRVGPVGADVFEGVVGISQSLAMLSQGWMGPRVGLASGLDRQHWDALGIDPFARWPGRDTNGELWVEGTDVKYFHKYLIQENGETSESDWAPVSEELFMANVENLGMDVESKPYGSFESEKLAEAAPPGMAYVGNPHYGRWASDGAGGTFWSWAGPYMFYSTLFGSPLRYGRSDWDTWSRDYRGSRPYYGGSSSAPRWGTRSQSVRTSPKMRGSTFARGGGFRRPAASIRSAASRSRSGAFGPSGK